MFIINIIGVIVMFYCGNIIVTGIRQTVEEIQYANESMKKMAEDSENNWAEKLGR